MNLLILLHVKSNHQAELAISTLTKRGAFLRKEEINAPPLNRVIAVGACDGSQLGSFVGCRVGVVVGCILGDIVGLREGVEVGLAVTTTVGVTDG